MLVQEFKKEFMEDVKAGATASGEGSCAVFVELFSKYLQNAESLADVVPAFYESTGKRNRKLRVDGYAYDELDNTMSLIIADYDGSEAERVLTKTQIKILQDRLVNFIVEAQTGHLHQNVEESLPIADLIRRLRTECNNVRKYQLLIFTTGKISASIKNIESDPIDGHASECQVWDFERLFKMCGSSSGRESIEIDFRAHSSFGIPCLEASSAITDKFRSYLCIVPGVLLADIYDKYGSMLLEGNVRSFLSTKVAVNKKIRETLLKQPDRFFAYNNGISATAKNITLETRSNGQFVSTATDFQIINGGQTTASLSNVRNKDKQDINNVFVQMKLTVIEKSIDEDATELVQDISRSSNSQNKVSDADFFSTHPFHINMERYSRRAYAKSTTGSQFETIWFYERARGQYLQMQMRMTPTEKKTFLLQHPKNQLISKTDLARMRNTWDGFPHIVSKGAQINFGDFAKKIDVAWSEADGALAFNEKYYKETVALAILFDFSEKMIPKQPWYQSGYRANIVTYTIALLHKLVRSQFKKYDVHLMNIWNRQTVPDVFCGVLTNLSELVYNRLTSSSRPVENVTQWCKQERCWEDIQKIAFDLPMDMRSALIDNEDMRIADSDAKAIMEIDSELDVQKEVLAILPEQWQEAYKFAKSKRLLRAQEEESVLLIVSHARRRVPTSHQCKVLLNVLKRLQEEGFKL